MTSTIPITTDQPTTDAPAPGSSHMRRPAPSAMEGEGVEEAESLAREEALRHSCVRAPR